jgi:Histone deacetylase domain
MWHAGTVLAADLALEHGLACSTAGGTHHASGSSGAGFCIINDLAITTELLLRGHPRINTVLVLDLDVHQGAISFTCFLLIIFNAQPALLEDLMRFSRAGFGDGLMHGLPSHTSIHMSHIIQFVGHMMLG